MRTANDWTDYEDRLAIGFGMQDDDPDTVADAVEFLDQIMDDARDALDRMEE
jgi:predicted component of type VI protein secretion system